MRGCSTPQVIAVKNVLKGSIVKELLGRTIPAWVCRILLAVVAASFISYLSALMQTQAAAAWAPFGLDKICDIQYTMDAPVYSTSTVDAGHTVDNRNVTPTKVSYTNISDFWGAYGSAGYAWGIYEVAPCQPVDTAVSASGTVMANLPFGWVISLIQLLRAFINVPFSNDFVSPFLSSDIVTSIFRHFNETLVKGGMLAAITSLGGAWLIFMWHKNGAKISLARIFGSIAAAGVASALVTSTITHGVYTTLNTGATQVSLAPAAAVSSSCSGNANASDAQTTVDCISGSFISRLINPVYASGAIGNNLGDQKAKFIPGIEKTPEELAPGSEVIYNKKSNSYISDKKAFFVFDAGGQGDAVKVKLPKAGVVPTVNSDNPTWSEYMHWTYAYTEAEREAITAGSIRGCNLTAMPGLEKLHEQAEKNPDLCTYKWMVRAALLYSAANGGGGYETAAGKTPFADRVPAAFTSFYAVSPVTDLMGVIGLHRMMLNLDIIFLALTLWFRFALIAGTGNWKSLNIIVGDHAIIAAKIVGVGLVLSGTALTQSIGYEAFEKALPGIPLFIRSILLAAITLLGGIVCYILYFRGLKKLTQKSALLAASQTKTIGGRLQAGAVKTLNAGAAVAGAALTGGASAALTMAGMQAIKNAKKDEKEQLDLEKKFTQGQVRGNERQRSREAKKQEETRRNNARLLIQDTEPRFNEALESTLHTGQEYAAINTRVGEAQTQHTTKAAALTGTIKQKNTEAQNAAAEKNTISEQKAAHDAKMRERVHLLLGAQQLYTDENGEPVLNDVGEPTTYADKISEASNALAQAQQDQAKAQAELEKYLSEHGHSVLHEMNYDENGEPVDITITDLATGQARSADLAEYDHDFSRSNVFPTSEDFTAYQDLKSALDAATSSAQEATSGYESITSKMRESSDRFSQDMYTVSVPTEDIAGKYELPAEAVAELRVSFEESASLRDLHQAAMSAENIARRAALTAQKDLDRANKAHARQMKDLTTALHQKGQEFNANANRARTLASRMDKAYNDGGLENVMKKVNDKNPYTVMTNSGDINLRGDNLREAADNAINEVRNRINLNTPPDPRRLDP